MSATDTGEGELECSGSKTSLSIRVSSPTLAKIIASDKENIQVVVEQWVGLWKASPSRALDGLLALLFESAGHKGGTVETVGDTVGAVGGTVGAEGSLLINSVGYQKKLRNFFKLLMSPYATGEMSLINRLTPTLISMCNSKWKSFRLTSIVVVHQIMLSLLEAEEIVSSEVIANDENLTDSEMEVELDRRNKLKDCINSHLEKLFREVIRLRIRDVESEIRLKSVQLVMDLIIYFPNKMAVDGYMKYINWSLSDQHSSVRLAAVKAIMKIVSRVNDLSKLGFFLKNNVPKLVVRIRDVDSKVAGAAIRAIDLIDCSFEGQVSNKIYEEMYLEVYSMEEDKFQAAGCFLLRKFGDSFNDDESLLNDLIKFQLESPLQNRSEFLISAIFKNGSFLTEWENWINFLSSTTDINRKVIVCQLLLHTMRVAVTAEVPPWRVMHLIIHPSARVDMNPPRQYRSTADEISCVNNEKSITTYFGKRVISLLKQYKDDPQILVYILAIPQYFHSSTDPVVMMSIIDEIQRIALTSGDVAVIHNSFHHLVTVINKLPEQWKTLALKKQESLISKIVDEFYAPTLKKVCSSEESLFDGEDEVNLEMGATLAKYFNLTTNTTILWSSIEGLQSSIEKQNYLGIKIFANVCRDNVLWLLKEVIDSLKVQENPPETEVEKLKELSQKLLHCSMEVLSLNLRKKTKCMAFSICCNLFTLFSIRNANLKKCASTVISPSAAQLRRLADFLRTTVPTSCETDTTAHLENEHLLAMYCKLLEDNIIPVSNIANVLTYFQVKEYVKILIRPLHALLRNEITMQSTVTCIIYGLELLLERCQKNEYITQQELENILDGIGASLHSKYRGLEKATQEIQVVGLECIHLSKNHVFFNILQYFLNFIRKTENCLKLRGLVMQYFSYLTDRKVVKTYLLVLEQVSQQLESVKHSQIAAAATDDDASHSDASIRSSIWSMSSVSEQRVATTQTV